MATTNGKLIWGRQMTWELVNHLEAFPELWLASCPDYKNRSKRATAIRKLAVTIGVAAGEVTRKLHNLRCQFNGEMRKIKRKSDEGLQKYTCNWEFFESMRYMFSQNDEPVADGNVNILARDHIFIPQEIKIEQEESIIPEDETILNSFSGATERPFDEYQIFGDFVAQELRSVQSQVLRNKLKRMIQRDILTIAEEDALAQSSAMPPLVYYPPDASD